MTGRTKDLRREVLDALEEMREIESQLAHGETSVAHKRIKATIARLQWLIRDEDHGDEQGR